MTVPLLDDDTMSRHRVVTTFAEGVTASDTFDSQPATPGGSMFLDGFGGVLRATGRKAAMLTQKGAQHELISANNGLQNLSHEIYFSGHWALLTKKTCRCFQVEI